MPNSAPAEVLDPASKIPDALPPPRTAARPTHFAFEHQVFAVKEAMFTLSPTNGEPSYNVPLGDVRATLPIDTVSGSFKIDKGSTDAQLLDIVKKSLKFVKEIRPGDSIPSEILDGTASWKVEPHHREIARARISVQLVSWMTGKSADQINVDELETVAGSADIKKRVQEALDVMAEKLGLASENKREVVTRFEDLAREMAYIEALRERSTRILKLFATMNALNKIYGKERSILEELSRVRALMKPPVDKIRALFEEFDVNTGDILNTMKRFAAQIRYIRQTRDDFHQRFMLWDDMLEKWTGVELERTPLLDRLIRVTYQFVARHFPQANDWGVAR